MKRIITLLVMLTSVAFAQTNSYQGEIDTFFKLLESGKSSEAVQQIYRSNPWMENKKEDIQQVDQQLSNLLELVGDYCGNEYLCETLVKGRFIEVHYLALYERQPVRFRFEFYKPKDKWMIFSFALDTDFDEDVEAVTKRKYSNLK